MFPLINGKRCRVSASTQDQCLHEPDEDSLPDGSPMSESFASGPSSAAVGAPPLAEAADLAAAGGLLSRVSMTVGTYSEAESTDKMESKDTTGAFPLPDAFADDYFDGQISYSDILSGCTDNSKESGGWQSPSEAPAVSPEPLQLESVHAIVFLPPKYHLLFRFTISRKTTIVRIVTDRPEVLGYIDAFFAATYALTLAAETQPH